MPLKRYSQQSSQSITEFYRSYAGLRNLRPDFVPNAYLKLLCEQMLDLLTLLDSEFSELPVWGLTSHYDLVLLPKDDFTLRSVIIESRGEGGFIVRYRLPEREPSSRLAEGFAKTPEEALDLIRNGMRKCEMWPSIFGDSSSGGVCAMITRLWKSMKE